MKIASTPDDSSTPDNNEERSKPASSEVDNLEDWDSFVFRPKFKKENNAMRYNGHYLTTGCVPVPKNDDGDRKIGSWNFHYKGWDAGQDTYRGVLRENTADSLFPKSQLGCLDIEVLNKLGISKEIVEKRTSCSSINYSFLCVILPSQELKTNLVYHTIAKWRSDQIFMLSKLALVERMDMRSRN